MNTNLADKLRAAAWDHFVEVIQDTTLDIAFVREEIAKTNKVMERITELWPRTKTP